MLRKVGKERYDKCKDAVLADAVRREVKKGCRRRKTGMVMKGAGPWMEKEEKEGGTSEASRIFDGEHRHQIQRLARNRTQSAQGKASFTTPKSRSPCKASLCPLSWAWKARRWLTVEPLARRSGQKDSIAQVAIVSKALHE